MEKQNYVVLSEGWLEDGDGRASYRTAGEVVPFNATQAYYMTLGGRIKLDEPKAVAPQAPKAK